MNLPRGAALFAVGLVVHLLGAPAAYAHAAYESSDPDDGATVSSPPSRVIANFTEPLIRGSRLDVYDPCGDKVDNGDSLVAGDQITVSMSADKQGRYTVTFNVVSAVDGHPTTGDFSFTSSGGAPCGESDQEGNEGPTEQPNNQSGGGSQGSSTSNASSSSGSGSSGGSGASMSGAAKRRQAKARDGQASGGRSGRPGFAARNRPRARVPNIQPAAASSEAQQPSVFEGIPRGTFGVGLLLAAIIGVAGGKMYAGIMGWTRPRRSKSRKRG